MADLRPIIYLAAPYSHPDLAVCEARYKAATCAAAAFIGAGHVVFSPLTMTHPIAMILGNHLSEVWYAFDEPFMAQCAEIVVLKIDGWRESKGVAAEVEYFEVRGRQVSYISEGELIPPPWLWRGGQHG